jgi:hypothetical protein
VFGLTSAVLNCTDQTTLDDFGSGILVGEDDGDYFSGKYAKAKGDVGYTNQVRDRD